jgi:radical SAM superfamily enzyme YgiQ (UPF0313 family)
MFLMWGYEGEELSDIEATVEHVKKTDPDIFFTTVAYPIKGTPYFSEVAERVESSKRWSEGSDRDFQIRNRHSRQFYRFADKLLRSEVELKRLRHKPDIDAATVAALQSGIADARSGLQATAAEVEV